MEQRIAVIGAGITGLATATLLQEAGHRVTVIEQAAAPALGASGHNGAQLSYDYVAPLADASIWGQLPKLLLDKTSPLRIKPSFDANLLRWLARFAFACNTGTARKTTQALLELGQLSRNEIRRLPADILRAALHARPGKLVVFRNAAALAAARAQVELQRTLGSKQQVLTATETTEIEPALAHDAAHIAGSVYTPAEEVVDCTLLCRALAQRLEQAGAQFLYQYRVIGWTTGGWNTDAVRRITAIRLHGVDSGTDTAMAFDQVIVAGGADVPALVKTLDMRLPIYPLKGYSISVPLAANDNAPRVSVTDAARKIVFARVGDQLRVAGMAELVGHDRTIDPLRVQQLKDATQTVFGPLAQLEQAHAWTGLRPATPTGRPIIGATPFANLWLNVGHGALGLTMAFGAARVLLNAIAARPQPAHAAVFTYA